MEMNQLLHILRTYEEASGQEVDFAKSEVFLLAEL
jgi:hypothetical protein